MKPEDIKIESIDPRPKGGQHVGVTTAIVRVTHIPTGLVAQCGCERSQMRNRTVALSMLEWGLAELGITDL